MAESGQYGPKMPCNIQCPCWTEEELANFPPPSDSSTCRIDSTYCGSTGTEDYSVYNWDSIRHTTAACDLESVMNIVETAECRRGAFRDTRTPECLLYYTDPVTCEVVHNREKLITRQEFAVCERQLNQYMAAHNLDCPSYDNCEDGYSCPSE
jgi:hypothetical protein